MSQQNIYDNNIFLEGYKNIRTNKANANILIEKPNLFALLPDLQNKMILDLGCGYGENCIEFVKKGAEKVIGIDISQKMLDIAILENCNPKIEYIIMPMENISELDQNFDIVVSSLALHYVNNFTTLVQNIYNLLSENGYFIFSQENPINTCFSNGNRWTEDENGHIKHANISNYSLDGPRKSKWFVDNVIKYHRTFSSIINTLITNNFSIEKMVEPIPTKEIIEQYPEYNRNMHKPDFLLIKAKKQ